MEPTLDVLVRRVQANMATRTVGVSEEMARGTVGDVLDALASETWEGQGPAEEVQTAWDELDVGR